jgi:hypothetical protein
LLDETSAPPMTTQSLRLIASPPRSLRVFFRYFRASWAVLIAAHALFQFRANERAGLALWIACNGNNACVSLSCVGVCRAKTKS